MNYLNDELQLVTAPDPMTAQDLHKALQEGIGKIRSCGLEPTEIKISRRAFSVLAKDNFVIVHFREGTSFLTYRGIKLVVENLPSEQIAVIVSGKKH